MKHFILFVFAFILSSNMFAQKVDFKGENYKVKNDIILLNGSDVTTQLSGEQRSTIFKLAQDIREQENKEIALELIENSKRKVEKEVKKIEKDKKRAEKALKKKERAHAALKKEKSKLKSAQKKYKKLKNKGKISPEDEVKWLKKIELQKEKISNAEKKLNRS